VENLNKGLPFLLSALHSGLIRRSTHHVADTTIVLIITICIINFQNKHVQFYVYFIINFSAVYKFHLL